LGRWTGAGSGGEGEKEKRPTMSPLTPLLSIYSHSGGIATWVIAMATVVNVFVYWRISRQTKQQIVLTKELFSEANRPRISVTIPEHGFQDTKLVVVLKVENFGTTTAYKTHLHFNFGFNSKAGNFGQTFGERVVQPRESYTEKSEIDGRFLTDDRLASSRFIDAFVDCTYEGIGDRKYSFRQNYRYDHEKGDFVQPSARAT
jgi:hypothetical protein